MNAQQDKPSATESQFDEWTKAVAHGLSRRKTLQLLSGGVSGLLLALSGPKSRAVTTVPLTAPAAPTGGGAKGCSQLCAHLAHNPKARQACLEACQCGQLCAPVFNLRALAPFVACAEACVDCKTCKGTPALTLTSPQVLVCSGATPCRSGSGVTCCSFDSQVPQNSQVCCTGTCAGPCVAGQTYNCSTHACECLSGTLCNGACVAPCPAGATLNLSTCQCVCAAGTTLCGSQCVTNCPTGQTLDPTTCTCGCASVTCGPNQYQDPTTCACVCNGGTTTCGSTCCASGQTCISGFECCPNSQACGLSCCAAGQTCTNGGTKCCPSSQACGPFCCAAGQTCANGICA